MRSIWWNGWIYSLILKIRGRRVDCRWKEHSFSSIQECCWYKESSLASYLFDWTQGKQERSSSKCRKSKKVQVNNRVRINWQMWNDSKSFKWYSFAKKQIWRGANFLTKNERRLLSLYCWVCKRSLKESCSWPSIASLWSCRRYFKKFNESYSPNSFRTCS